MARVPVIRLDDTLIATVQDELYDRDALQLHDDLGRLLDTTTVHGVLLDLSKVETVDSFLARLIGSIAAMTRLLGAETVVVGIQPAVAITLVELGLALPGVLIARDAAHGLRQLARVAREPRPRRSSHDG
jgi:rsbT antagonist protein RsbS